MRRLLSLAFVALIGVPALQVHAHFKLLAPASWVTEDDTGGPQKGGPCGPGGADDVQPVPMTMKVTTFHAGETIQVEFDETIHHPGWFRIALAADRSALKDPDFPNSNCTVDMSNVPTTPHDNVLVDGLAMDNNIAGSNRKFMQMVKLPDQPCEKCTLQVIQVMADALHAPPGCVYHHCADVTILPATSSSGSAGAPAVAGAAGSLAGAAGAGSGAAGASSSAGTHAATTAAGSGGTAGTVAVATGAAGKSSAGTGSVSNATSSSGASSASPTPRTTAPTSNAGTPAATTPEAPPASTKSGGCAVARVSENSPGLALCFGVVVATALSSRRRRTAARSVHTR